MVERSLESEAQVVGRLWEGGREVVVWWSRDHMRCKTYCVDLMWK